MPIPAGPRTHRGLTICDAKDPQARFPEIEPLRPPVGAPDVLIILLDDVGFGSSSARRWTREHAHGRATRRSGVDPSPRPDAYFPSAMRPGDVGSRPQLGAPDDCAPLAQILKLTGYSTPSSVSVTSCRCGRRVRWGRSAAGRLVRGEYSYGFIGGEANQYYATLYEGTTRASRRGLRSGATT